MDCRNPTSSEGSGFGQPVAYGLLVSRRLKVRIPLVAVPEGLAVTRRSGLGSRFLMITTAVLAGFLATQVPASPAPPPIDPPPAACIACHVKPSASPQPAPAAAETGCVACHKTQAPADAAACEACHHK